MLGIDLGGSKLLAIKVDKKRITWKKKFSFKEKSRREILDLLMKIIKESEEKKVGIGVPGIFKKGRIIRLPHLPQLDGLNLEKELKRVRVKAKIDNDANCFALGEYFRWKKNLVGLTIGTGIGGGIIINGKIYHGKRDAGEFGHMSIFANGRKCVCGNRGCLEEYVSTRAFMRESKKVFGKALTPEELNRLARKGNKKAVEVFNRIGRFLGIGLANIADILNPELISIGGGIAKAGKFLLNPAREEMRRRIFVAMPKLVIGKETSGAFGAAMLWRYS